MDTSFITKNNAGIVEAIKRKSGSTKFYKPSFEGIIEAILDWEGGESGDHPDGPGSLPLPEGGPLPDTGNTDGDLVVIPNGDGNYFMYVFVDGKWEKLHVTTEEVETAGSAPFALVTDDGVTLTNQKEINAYLYEKIEELKAIPPYDDSALEMRVAALELEVQELPVIISDLEPLPAEDGDLWWNSKEDSLQLFVHYKGEWIVASPPVSTDDIENAIFQLQKDVKVTMQTVGEHENRLDNIIAFSPEPPTIVPDEEQSDGTIVQSELNSKFWVNTDTDQLHILRKTEDGYEYQLASGGSDVKYAPDDEPPSADAHELWFNTTRLELLISYESQWWPVSLPASQLEDLRKILERELIEVFSEIESVQQSTGKALRTVAEEIVKIEGDLNILEEQLEDVVPSIERGKWEFSADAISIGLYNIYRDYTDEYCTEQYAECVAANQGDSSALTQCNREFDACKDSDPERIAEWKGDRIWFNQIDLDSTNHSWENVEAGEKLEIVNEDGSGFALYEVTDGQIVNSSGRIGIPVVHERSQGAPSGTARVKLFTIADVDASNLVHKTGDIMTGKLEINKPRTDSNTNSFVIKGRIKNKENQVLLKDYRRKQSTENKDDYMEYFGSSLTDNSIANRQQIKEWINNAIARPAHLRWKFDKSPADKVSAPKVGHFHIDGNIYRFNFLTDNGINLGSPKPSDKLWKPHKDDQFIMTFWVQNSTYGWEFFTNFECNNTRWGSTVGNGGSHIEFERRWSSHGEGNEFFSKYSTYYVTVGGFF